MRTSVAAIVAACLSVPGTAQITNPGDNPSLNQFFDGANQCLSDFEGNRLIVTAVFGP
jgi:hypothetical protein